MAQSLLPVHGERATRSLYGLPSPQTATNFDQGPEEAPTAHESASAKGSAGRRVTGRTIALKGLEGLHVLEHQANSSAATARSNSPVCRRGVLSLQCTEI